MVLVVAAGIAAGMKLPNHSCRIKVIVIFAEVQPRVMLMISQPSSKVVICLCNGHVLIQTICKLVIVLVVSVWKGGMT